MPTTSHAKAGGQSVMPANDIMNARLDRISKDPLRCYSQPEAVIADATLSPRDQIAVLGMIVEALHDLSRATNEGMGPDNEKMRTGDMLARADRLLLELHDKQEQGRKG